MKMVNAEFFQKYIHPNWDDISHCKSEKYYFVKTDVADLEKAFSEIQYQLSVETPKDLKAFFKEVGFGFLWFNLKTKKGLYRILSPEEILDLYFEPDDDNLQDDFTTYRENAWNNLEENKLMAFCLFGEEDSLIYIGLSDGGIYYLSPKRRIANSLNEFLDLLDAEVDYFMQ